MNERTKDVSGVSAAGGQHKSIVSQLTVKPGDARLLDTLGGVRDGGFLEGGLGALLHRHKDVDRQEILGLGLSLSRRQVARDPPSGLPRGEEGHVPAKIATAE